MKKPRMRAAGMAIVLAAALCSSCANLFGTGAKTGSVSITLSAPSAKAVVPGASDYSTAIKAYKVTVSSSSTGNSYTSTIVASGVCTITGIYALDSTTGVTDYAVTVLAYNSATTQDSTTLIAQGSASGLTVKAGATAAVTIALSFSQSATAGAANAGGFSLPISWPVSTSLAYVYATVDGSAIAVPTVTTGSTYYTATLAASGFSGGSHLLAIYFKTSSGATAVVGPFYESVNIWDGVTCTQWADPNGTLQSTRTFEATEFSDTNANLSALSISGATLAPAFAAATTGYSLSTGFTATTFAFTATLVVGTQDIAATWNGSALAWSSVNGSTYSFTVSSLQLISGTNSLSITVTAPDRTTTKTYTVTVNCGAAGITITKPAVSGYEGLQFPATVSIVQGQPFVAETGNATLDAITSGWAWYLDGAAQSETSQRFVLSPSTTENMIGTYTITGSVVSSAGVKYSGSTTLTVTWKGCLNLVTPTTTALSLTLGGSSVTLGGPYDICYSNSYVYVADTDNHRILKVDPSTSIATVLAGDGTAGYLDATGSSAKFGMPFALATDGSRLFVADTTYRNIREIVLATGVVTTLAGNASGATSTGYADATGTAARFSRPAGLWTDGTTLYVCDWNNSRIRAIDIASKAVTTFAGTGAAATTDGTGTTSAAFYCPYRITGGGTYLYVTQYGDGCIRKIDITNAAVSTFTPTYTNPAGIVFDGTDLYLCNADDHTIARLTLAGGSTTIASGFSYPKGITSDGSKLYIADTGHGIIKELTP